MQKLYPKGPGTIDVDYGISIRTLYERCPELNIETKFGKEYIEGVISYRGRNLYFVMDQNEVIHKFSCYDDENNRVIKFICDRLRVDWIKEEEYEKLVDKKDNLSNYTLDPNLITFGNNFDTKALADAVQTKNRANQLEKLEPRQFYAGVFRMFCQINTKPVHDTDEIWSASIVLYREFLVSKYNKSSFNKSEELSQINDFLNDTIQWAENELCSSELPF